MASRSRPAASAASAAGLGATHGVVVSPDGLNVYATGFADDSVVAFQRTPGAPGGGGGGGTPGAIQGTVNPDGTGQISVTVGCSAASVGASTAQAAQQRPQTCTIVVDGNLDWTGMQGRQVAELRQHDVAAFKTRANKLIDDAFSA